jgi:hypothetical protein
MFVFLLLATIGFQPVGSTEQVDFLRVSFKANKDAFAFGTFQFEYTKGRCASLSDAEAEVFSKSINEDGLYVFDGKNERYDLLAGPAALAAVTTRIGKNQMSSIAMVFRALTDGEVTLRDQLWLDDSDKFSHRSPEIYPGTATFCSDGYFQIPLSLGNCDRVTGDLFSGLTAVKDGKGTITELDFDSRLEGLPVCRLSFTYTAGKCTYWIDRNRGCLPLRIQLNDDRTGAATIYRFSEFEHVANAGWLPRRRMHIWANGRLADRIVVTRIDTTNRPGRSMFQLDFPEPIALHDQARHLLYSKRKVWSLLDLPRASSPDARRVSPQNTLPAEMPGEIETSFDWRVPIAGVILLAIVVSIIFLMWRGKISQVR